MKFAFYGGAKWKGRWWKYSNIYSRKAEVYTDWDWDLLNPDISTNKAVRGPSYATSPQDFHPGCFPSESHNDILRFLLTSPFIPKLLPHVRGLTPMWGSTHLEKPRPLGAQPLSPWISDSHRFIIRWHALTLSCTYSSSSLMDTRVHLSPVVMSPL